MNSTGNGRVRAAIAARVAAVALVLACLAPQGMEARVPALASIGGGGAPPPGLSAADWTAIQARLAQAVAHAPLVTSQVAKLTASDAAADDWFGDAVAASGDTVVVGVPYDDDGGNYSGSAYVFERNQGGADNWGQVAKLTASDATAYGWFGHAVSISGDTVVVGADGDDNWSGAAYVYERNQGGADNWGQVEKLTADDAAASDWFGCAVATSGDTVVVGADRDDDGGEDSGSAYVFERNKNGADSWGQVTKLTAGDAAAGDYFGHAVAISGDTVVVGAWKDDSFAGAAYVFARNYDSSTPSTPVADNWGQVQKLTASDAAAGDCFGYAVAITGDTIVVGADGDDGYTGSAYIFARNYDPSIPSTPVADNWGQVQKLTAADAATWDRFGHAVAVGGGTVVVGAYIDDDGGENSGSAYVFERNQGGADNWGHVQKLTASDAEADDLFGCAVAISGDTVVVGAYADDSHTGSAYVFARRGAADPTAEAQCRRRRAERFLRHLSGRQRGYLHRWRARRRRCRCGLSLRAQRGWRRPVGPGA